MRALILFALVASSSVALGQGKSWSIGTGFEGRAQQAVNPQYVDTRGLPHFFTQYRFSPWAISLEGGYERHESGSGGFTVASKSIALGLWGRYEFRETSRWAPFASVGIGTIFDTVESDFGGGQAHNRSAGQRHYLGAGGGIAKTFWKHLLTEAEIKTVLIEDRRDVAWSAILRVGLIL